MSARIILPTSEAAIRALHLATIFDCFLNLSLDEPQLLAERMRTLVNVILLDRGR